MNKKLICLAVALIVGVVAMNNVSTQSGNTVVSVYPYSVPMELSSYGSGYGSNVSTYMYPAEIQTIGQAINYNIEMHGDVELN